MISNISQLIAQVESNGRTNAVRFEPAYHPDPRSIPLAKTAMPGLSFMTYETLLACSWGQFQIMGDNLYLLGLDVHVNEFWSDADMQRIYFDKFCESRGIAYSLDDVLTDQVKREHFARRYNGDAVGYANRMMQVYQQYKGQ